MGRTQCVLALLATLLGLVQSWKAVTSNNQIEFYRDTTLLRTVTTEYSNLKSVTYDAVHERLLIVDSPKKSDVTSIFSFDVNTNTTQTLIKRTSENIEDLAYDPVQDLLFWTDTNTKTIYWVSLKPESLKEANVLIKLDDDIPKAIAVDSCRGFIYWANANEAKPSIEKIKFDGTDRQVVIDSGISKPITLALDQMTKKIYFMDDKPGIRYTIESADLDGSNRVILLDGYYHEPTGMDVSKDSVIWADRGFGSVWRISKFPVEHPYPLEVSRFRQQLAIGVAAYYTVQDQTEGIEECEALRNLLAR